MEYKQTFNNWSEVSDWWTNNSKAIRIKPEISEKSIIEYNEKNHQIQFPCEFVFEIPE